MNTTKTFKKDQSLKIAICLVGDFPEGTGASSRMLAFAKSLKRLNHQPEIFLLRPTVFNDNLCNTQVKGEHEGIPFEYLTQATDEGKGFFQKSKRYFRSQWNFLRQVLMPKSKFDFYYFYTPALLPFFFFHLYLKLRNKNVVFEFTEHFSTLSRGKFNFLFLKTRLKEVASPYFTHHLFCISTPIYRFYRYYLPASRVHLFPILVEKSRFKTVRLLQAYPLPYRWKISSTGVKPKKWSLSVLPQTFTLGYVGSFGAKDGVAAMVRAFQQAKLEIPHLKLRLMGHSENGKWIAELKQVNGIQLIFQPTAKEIPHLLQGCDCLIVNRTNDAFAHHGFPTKLGEYLATGRPVIATKVGDLLLYLKHGKEVYAIPPEDEAALTQAMLKRYNDKTKFDGMGERGRIRAMSCFEADQNTQRVLRLLSGSKR